MMNIERGIYERSAPEAQGRFFYGLTKGVDLKERTVTGIGSTIELDRDGEIILPESMEADLPRFLASNAPFKAQHARGSANGSPVQIGWIMDAAIEEDGVPMQFRYATHEAAEAWWRIASDPKGKGHAFSIGFIPKRWVLGSPADLARDMPKLRDVLAKAGVPDNERVRVYTEIELIEVSACDTPSNRGCLQTRGNGGDAGEMVTRAELEAALAGIRSFVQEQVDSVLMMGGDGKAMERLAEAFKAGDAEIDIFGGADEDEETDPEVIAEAERTIAREEGRRDCGCGGEDDEDERDKMLLAAQELRQLASAADE